MEGGHTGGIRASGRAFLKHAQSFFQRGNSGIAVTRIDVALLLACEHLVHFDHGIISKRGGRIDRSGDRLAPRDRTSFTSMDQLGINADPFIACGHLQLLSTLGLYLENLRFLFLPLAVPQKRPPRQKNLRESLKTSSGSLAVFNVEQVTSKSPRSLDQNGPIKFNGESLCHFNSGVKKIIFMER